MFFDLVLLNRQHRGRFGIAWIAATRGVKHLHKNDILEVDVMKLCEEVVNFICSESDSPRSRFSLRLSAILINGIVKIYRQKANYYIDEMMKFLLFVSTPTSIRFPEVCGVQVTAPGAFETPSPVTKVKIKRRRLPVEKETPQSQLEKVVQHITEQEIGQILPTQIIEEPVIIQRQTDEITIREAHPQSLETVGIADFGVLGSFQAGEEELATLEEFGIRPLEPLPREEVAEPICTSSRLGFTATEESPEEPPVKFTVQAQVHVPAETEMIEKLPTRPRRKSQKILRSAENLDKISSMEEPLEIAVLPVEPRLSILEELPKEVVEERDKTIVEARKRKKKKSDDLVNVLFSTSRAARVVRINRCEREDLELTGIGPSLQSAFKLKTPNLTNTLNLYLIKDGRDLQERRQISEPSSLRDTVMLSRKSGQLTPVELSEEERTFMRPLPASKEKRTPQLVSEIPKMLLTETQLPLMASTPLSRTTEIIEIDSQRGRDDIEGVTKGKSILSPRKKRKLHDGESEYLREPELSKEREMPSRELASSIETRPQEIFIEAVPFPVPVMTEKDRHQRIIDQIVQSDHDRLTLEEVCSRPVNRLNIARTFSDLLVLCRHGYVKLISEDADSSLKFIEKGPKMTRHN